MPRVVVFVFDGLQMSQVTPRLTPNLAAFASRGVRFGNHHPVFPTVTRVNVASITTGRYPGGHGLAGNNFVHRDMDPGRVLPALRPELSEVIERTGRLLLAPNLASILGAKGMEYVAVGTGSDGNAFMHNPMAARDGGATIHPDFCEPDGLYDDIVSRFGPWPEITHPAEARIERGVTVLTEYVLQERDPAVALFWSSEPDACQHRAGLGSELATRALGVADAQFGRLLSWLKDTGRDSDTAVLVAADHGYCTVIDDVPVTSLLQKAGFPTGSGTGEVMVASNGGSMLYYVGERDPKTADRLASWLVEQPWSGAMVTSDALGEIEGTLPASLVGVEGPRAPDIAMSFAWNSSPNDAGYAGHHYNSGLKKGQGNHGSMSRHEQRCAFIMAGPKIRQGVVSSTPSGNVDIAPTILHLLGLDAPDSMDGRALEEAFTDGPAPDEVEWSSETHDAERELTSGTYRQQIMVSRVGETTYVNEGSAQGPG